MRNTFNIKPIAKMRGCPSDLSKELANYLKNNNNGPRYADSYTYLHELLDYDWIPKTKIKGFVTEEQYKVFLEKGKPDTWITNVADVKCVAIDDNRKPVMYIPVKWEIHTYETANLFYIDAVPYLRELSKSEKYDDVRIVYYFDH